MASTTKELLSAMNELRSKSQSNEVGEFVLVQQANNQWPLLFDAYFISKDTRLPPISANSTSADDLIFYVTKKIDEKSQNVPNVVEVFRHHDEKRQPVVGAPEYDWEETTNLNLILHQFEYTVIAAICIRTSSKSLQIIKSSSTKVYANPSRRDMKEKATEEKITFPHIYFSVDNFEDAFCKIHLDKGQMICVELIAQNPRLSDPKVLFLGSVKYEDLLKAYETRAKSNSRVSERISLAKSQSQRVEFLKMRGPNGKGHAEMAISLYRPTKSNAMPSDSRIATSNSKSNDQENNPSSSAEDHWKATASSRAEEESNAATSVVESTDIRQDLGGEAAGSIGRRLSQVMSWVRSSPTRNDETSDKMFLHTCLTYLTLPCQSIVQDILDSNARPLLTGRSVHQ